MKFKYVGLTKTLGKFGQVGTGSVLEMSHAEAVALDGKNLERVRDGELVNIITPEPVKAKPAKEQEKPAEPEPVETVKKSKR